MPCTFGHNGQFNIDMFFVFSCTNQNALLLVQYILSIGLGYFLQRLLTRKSTGYKS